MHVSDTFHMLLLKFKIIMSMNLYTILLLTCKSLQIIWRVMCTCMFTNIDFWSHLSLYRYKYNHLKSINLTSLSKKNFLGNGLGAGDNTIIIWRSKSTSFLKRKRQKQFKQIINKFNWLKQFRASIRCSLCKWWTNMAW